MNWYSEGFDGAEEAVKKAQARRKPKMWRFFLRSGESKTISFLDDRAFSFMEHNYKHNGRWGNYATCIGRQNGCPFCLADNNPYRVTVFTVIDHSVFTDKQGKAVTDTKKILAAKEDQALILKRCKDQWGGLKGQRVVVTRGTGQRSPAWGESFALDVQNGQIIRTDWSKYPREFLTTPTNYVEMFAAMSREELAQIYNHSMFTNNQSFPQGSGYGAGSPPPMPAHYQNNPPQAPYQPPPGMDQFPQGGQPPQQAPQGAQSPQQPPAGANTQFPQNDASPPVNEQAVAAGLPPNLEDIPF